ncbi:hypothetical protein [Sphingomonas sp. UYEF23]|uniref:hypothetical protein n=1 Tax=Sphingomonas sp. UYEF23 TaxID=1756408 RepID=UPI0033937731
MYFDFGPLLLKLGSLTFAQLANVQTVGIGLYLALAAIQAVTEGGVAALRRRANTLEAAIASARKQLLRGKASSILTDVGGLEMGFQRVNRTVLYAVFVLFTVSVAAFGLCTIWQDDKATAICALAIMGFYLLLPVVIFLSIGLYVKRRCAVIDARITTLQTEYLTAALGD